MARLHRAEDYFAGVLEGRERDAFERHLESCPECQKALEELKRLDGKLAAQLPRTIPQREPRREWLESLGYDLPMPRRGRFHRLWLLAAPAIAAALVVLALVLFHPWGGPSDAQLALQRAYHNTIGLPFTGDITVMEGGVQMLSGTFQHAPGDRWAMTLRTFAISPWQEVEVEGRRWERAGDGNGFTTGSGYSTQNDPNEAHWKRLIVGTGWMSVESSAPLYILPQDVAPLERPQGLLEGLVTLDRVQATGERQYKGVDMGYRARTATEMPGTSWAKTDSGLAGHPPVVEVTLSEGGALSHMQLIFETETGGPVVVALDFGRYGEQVNIEPPTLQPSPTP